MPGMTCRAAVLGLVLCAAALSACGCSRPVPDEPQVVLYTSADDPLAREIIAAFTEATGIGVLLVGDTEATKTTGLVERLIAERASPRCDVWWSSESVGTLRLAEEGLLEPYRSGAEVRIAGGWPAGLVDPLGDQGADGPMWYGFACRSRVIAFDTRDMDPAAAPRSLEALTAPEWKGRVGMARPEFGTTRGHMAALAAACGPEVLREWLIAMKANGLRIYDGNSAVVRAIAQGEIDVGLTDTDDVWAARREGWPVGASFEVATGEDAAGLCSRGPLLIPNTVALVRGAPHPQEARALIDFLLGPAAELVFGASDSHNLPVVGELPPELAAFGVPGGWAPPPGTVAAAADEASRICRAVLGSQ